jgi:hypothetical protein
MGSCVDTAIDPANCGRCGNACTAAPFASAVCASGTCARACAPGRADCNGDLGRATGSNGCEIDLVSDVAHCGGCGLACTIANGTGACSLATCRVGSCTMGFGDCDGLVATGCEATLADDEANCGMCGMACGPGQLCLSGSCGAPLGDDCSNPFLLTSGMNTVDWTAFNNDYLMMTPSCVASGTTTGPDIVLSYTATSTGYVTFELDKPTSTRWVAVVASGACGTISPSLACVSDFSAAVMSGRVASTAGTTYYVYVADTTSGTMPLSDPLSVRVNELDCSTFAASVTAVDPPSGTTTTVLNPTLRFTFDSPISRTVGVITLTGSLGTTRTYDLAMAPPQVTFATSDTVMSIAPGALPPNETFTVSWTGLADALCMRPVAPPTYSFTTPTPPCAPGVGGMVAGTYTRVATTGLSATYAETYLAADENPAGYVYAGNGTTLYRVPKAGGAVEAVHTAAALTSNELGSGMLIDGSNIYVIDDGEVMSGLFHRITTNGGMTWMLTDMMALPMNPGDDFRSGVVFGGRIHLLTREFDRVNNSEIWSLDPTAATLPTTPTLDRTFVLEEECSGIAMDANNYYIACWEFDRLIRVERATGAVTLLTTAFDLQITRNEVYAQDLDMDGTADVLYVQFGLEQVGYVCEPDGATPFVGTLVDFREGGSASTSNFGLAYDRTANVLWAYDDDNQQLIRIP